MNKRYVLHYVILPAILVGSDLFIGFFGHYSGTVGLKDILSYSKFVQYIMAESTKAELAVVFIIALIVVALVELIVQEDRKWQKRIHGKR